MGSRDERIVEMKFDNAQFEQGVAKTQQSLTNLGKSLHLIDGTTAFSGLSNAAKNIDLSSIAAGVENLTHRFSLMGIIGMKVMEEVAQYGINVIKGIWNNTFGQIKSGGIKRAFNIENAHFMLQGLLKDEKEVQRIMNLASKSVDGTAYSYDAAAKAASQFAASGIRGNEELEVSLRAITGVAAMTNSEYEDISRIFTTVAGNGRLMGDQLLQLSGRGMNAAATLADFFNGINDGSKTASEGVTEYVKSITNGTQIAEADIRDMVSKGKIDFATFSAAMDEAFGEHALKANETFTGAMSNVRAALSRIGAKFVSPLIEQNGNLVQMLNSLRLMINAINKEMDPFANAFVNTVKGGADALKYFMDNLNVSDLFKGFAEALRIVSKLLSPIGKAFREAFIVTDGEAGVNTIDKINAAITRFREKLESIKPYHATLTKIQNTFAGVFAVVKIGLQIISALIQTLLPVKKTVNELGHGVLDLTSSWGEWLVNLEASLRESDIFVKVFTKVRDAIVTVVTTIGEAFQKFWEFTAPFREKLVTTFSTIYDKIKSLKFDNIFGDIKGIFKKDLDPETIGASSTALEKLKNAINNVKEALKKARDKVLEFIGGLSESIDTTSVSSTLLSAFKYVIEGLSTALRMAIDLIAQFGGVIREKIGAFFQDFSMDKLIDIFTTGAFIVALKKLSGALAEFQASILVDDLKAIAESIGILTLSLVALSFIDPGKLEQALKAITALFTELSIAYVTMTGGIGKGSDGVENKIGRFIGAVTGLKNLGGLFSGIKKYFEMKSIMEVSKAILVLVGALWLLSLMDVESMKTGILGLTVIMAEVAIMARIIGGIDATKMNRIGGQMLSVSAGVLILAGALAKIASLDTEKMGMGLVGIGVLFAEVGALMKSLNKNSGGNVKGFAIIEVATGIMILAKALAMVGSLNATELGLGLAGIGAGMFIIAKAVQAMTGSTGIVQTKELLMMEQTGSVLKTGAAILMVATSMLILAGALKIVGSMDLEQVAKGLIGLGGAMAIIVISFNKIDNDQLIKTAVAISLVSTAMVILGGALAIVGNLDLEEIAKGLIGLGGAMAIMVIGLNALTGASGIVRTKDIFLAKQQGSILKSASAILIVAGALTLMAGVIGVLGSMDITTIGKGLLGLGGAMAIVVASLKLVDPEKALKTAGGIAAMAGAFNLLVPPLVILGHLSFEQIMHALISIAGAIVIMKAACVGLGPMSDDLLVISGSLALFGVACAGIGVGVLALSVAFETLVMTCATVPGAIGLVVGVIAESLKAVVIALADTIGYLLVGIAKGIVDCIKYLADHQAEIVGAITTIFTALLAVLVELVAGGIYALVRVCVETFERLTKDDLMFRLIDSLFTLIHQVLIGLEKHVDEFVTDVVRLFVLVVYSLIKNLNTILTACVVFVVSFVKGLAAIIVEQSGPIVQAVTDIVLSIAYLVVELLKQLLGWIPGLEGALNDAQGWIVDHMSEETGEQIIENWANGVDEGIQKAGDRWSVSASKAAMQITAAMRNGLNGLEGATIQGPKEDMIGFQSAQYNPDAYYYNRKGHASYNPDKDYTLNPMPSFDQYATGYSGAESLGQGWTDGSKNIQGIFGSSGDTFTGDLMNSMGGMYDVGSFGTDEFATGWLENTDYAEYAVNYTGQSAVGTLSYYIPQYGVAGSDSINKYGEMVLAGTDKVVKSSDKVAGASVGKIAEYYSRYSQTGSKNVDAYIASVYAGKGDAEKAGGGVGSSNVYGLASVNPALKATGSDAIANYAGGIAGAVGKSTSAAAGVASESVDSAGVYKDEFWVAGNQATIGFANGITEMISKAISAAGSVARAALSQLKAVLGIHSPSRAFMEAGEYSGEGFVIGLQSYESAISKESVKIADLSINALAEGMKQISEIADNDMNYEPTIKPVFDFTDVNTGISTLNGLMTSNSAIAASASFDMSNRQNDILGQIVAENSRHEEVIDGIINRQTTALNDIRRLLANQVIVLDSGELIGQTIQKIDGELNNLMTYKERGN